MKQHSGGRPDPGMETTKHFPIPPVRRDGDVDEASGEFRREDAAEADVRVWQSRSRRPPVELGDTIRLDTAQIRRKAESAADRTVRFRPDEFRQAAEPEPPEPGPAHGPHAERRTAPVRKEKAPKPRQDHTPPKPRTLDACRKEAEKGLAGCCIRAVLCGISACAAILLALLSAQGSIRLAGGDGTFLPFLELILLLLCALLCHDILAEGLGRLLRLQPDWNGLLALAVVLTAADGAACVLGGRESYGPVLCAGLAASLWARCTCRRGRSAMLDAVGRTGRPAGLRKEPEYWKKYAGILHGEGNREDFLDNFDRPAWPERLLALYGLGALLAAVAVAGVTCGGEAVRFLHIWDGVFLAALPPLGLFVLARPRAVLNRRLAAGGAAICGWRGICRLSGRLAVPVADGDLFPPGSLKMNGVKYFGDCPPDMTLAFGTAVIAATGSGLSEIFLALLEQRNGRRLRAERLRRYDNGGVGAEVNGTPVLMGSLKFMQSMGVEMPAGTRVNQAVYVSVDGELSGVFAVSYGVSRASAAGLQLLARCRGIELLLTARDFMITDAFLQAKFRVAVRRIHFLPIAEREQLARRQPSEPAVQCALLLKPGLAPAARAVSGARLARAAVLGSLGVSLLSGLTGLTVMSVLAFLGAWADMSVSNLLLFLGLWALPACLLASLTSGS